MNILDTLKADIAGVETKVVTFISKEVMAAESLLGAKTGNQKLNIVVTAVEAGLSALGVDTSKISDALTAAVNAIVALFNVTGMLPKPAAS